MLTIIRMVPITVVSGVGNKNKSTPRTISHHDHALATPAYLLKIAILENRVETF